MLFRSILIFGAGGAIPVIVDFVIDDPPPVRFTLGEMLTVDPPDDPELVDPPDDPELVIVTVEVLEAETWAGVDPPGR